MRSHADGSCARRAYGRSMPSRTFIPASPEAAADGLADRMKSRTVIAVSEDASLRQAERAMVRHGVHAILVLGRSTGQSLGWVTSRGMLKWITHDLALIPASQGMTETPTFIEPGGDGARRGADALGRRCLASARIPHTGRDAAGRRVRPRRDRTLHA